MNTKRILIGLLAGALLITGCSSNSLATDITDGDKEPVAITPGSNEFIAVGIALEINEDNIHVMSGDMVEIYNVPPAALENIYLGETVAILESSDSGATVTPYIIDDFSVRHTNMGHLIDRVNGTITEITDETITIQSGQATITASSSEGSALEVGRGYEFDLVSFTEENTFLIDTYSSDQKLTLTIEELTRLESGELSILGRDQSGGQYIVNTYLPVKNFNLSELKTDQIIEVYATVIMESFPAQVEANRIDLIQ